MMLKKIAYMLVAPLMAVMIWCGGEAQGGVLDSGLRSLVRVVTSGGGKAARNFVGELAEQSPTWARLVRNYGDDAVVTLARHPERVQLVHTLGDDAAEALLKHTNIAENTLRLCPDAKVASALGAMNRESAQYLSMCTRKFGLGADDCKTMVLMVREGGEEAAERLAKMSPSKLDEVLKAAKFVGLGAAVTMVMTSESPADLVEKLSNAVTWMWDHPVLSLAVLTLLVGAVCLFPQVTVKVICWLPKLCLCAVMGVWKFVRECWQRRRDEVRSSDGEVG